MVSVVMLTYNGSRFFIIKSVLLMCQDIKKTAIFLIFANRSTNWAWVVQNDFMTRLGKGQETVFF